MLINATRVLHSFCINFVLMDKVLYKIEQDEGFFTGLGSLLEGAVTMEIKLFSTGYYY